VRKADNLPPSCAVVTKSGNLNFLEPSGPVQVCNGTALLYIKQLRFIKMCLNETCGRVGVSKHLSYMFAIMNGLKQGDVIRRVQVN